jgi:hypothetical protein
MQTHTGIIDDWHTARRHPLAAFFGFAFGAWIPWAVWNLSHEIATWRDPRAILVAGGLLFSAKTVWQWGRKAFDCPYKATGFVLITEGIMITSGNALLSRTALMYLVAINAIATACTIARENVPKPQPTVTSVARELGLPRKQAAKALDRQLAAAKPRPA